MQLVSTIKINYSLCEHKPTLEPRLSVLDFVSKAVRQNPEQKAWVQG